MGDYKEKVGEPTGEMSTVGRPIYKTSEGEMVSEQSTTFKYKGKWINIPTIHNGYSYNDDELRLMLDHDILKPTSTHKNIKAAEKAAEAHSSTLRNFAQGGLTDMNNQTQRAFALGGEAETRDPVSGNDVPPGSLPVEVRDDLPARLSEGEYVVPADVVRFFGVKFFEDLRTQAKMGLQQMDADGRIGGDPVPSMGEDTLSDEQFNEILMAELGTNGPETERAFAHGGVHYGFGGGSDQYFGSGGFDGAPKSAQGNTKVTLVSADGKSTKVYLSPKDDALIDYWKGRGYTVGPVSTGPKPKAPSNDGDDMTTAEREAIAENNETESTPWYEEDPKFFDKPAEYIKDQLKIGNKFLASDKGKGLGLLFPIVGVAGAVNFGAQAFAASKARSTFDFHKALGTEGFNKGDEGYAELEKSLEDAGYDTVAPGTMRNDQIARRLGFNDFEDASNSSNTEKLKTRYQTMQNTIKYAKSLEEAGTSINEGQGASFDYSNLIFKDDDSTTVTDIREQGVDDINNPNKGDMTTTEREAIKVGADRYGGGTYMGTDKDGGFDVYTDAIKRPKLRPNSLPTSTTGNSSTATSNSTSVNSNSSSKTKASPGAFGNQGGVERFFDSIGLDFDGDKKNKGGLISKPKKTKKKAKAYKRGGLASKKK